MLTSSFGIGLHGLWRGLAGAAKRCIGFLRADRGIAATEFALLLPIMILLYAGSGEISQAVMTSRRTESLARTLVDLISQQPTSSQTSSTNPVPSNATNQAALQSILTASTAVMAPTSLSTLTMTVSAVDIVNNAFGVCCVFKVRWSYTQSGTLRPCNVNLTPVPPTQAPSPTTVSSAMMPPLAGLPLPNPVSMLISDVSVGFTGPFSSNWITLPARMSRTNYMLPRTTGQVLLGPVTASGNQTGAVCY